MSRYLPAAAAVVAMMAASGSAAVGAPETVCQHKRSAECRAFTADNAFRGYAESRWVVSDPGGGGLGCLGESPRWKCTLSAEGPGGMLGSCRVTGTVVEVKPGADEVRHARATQVCAKRKGPRR